jgi:hypothetical protein
MATPGRQAAITVNPADDLPSPVHLSVLVFRISGLRFRHDAGCRIALVALVIPNAS